MNAKTPVFQDKRFWLAVSTVAALLVSNFLGKDLEPELLATIAMTVVGFITASATKEASVSKALVAADVLKKTPEGAPSASPSTPPAQ